jgi:hypothetical protein
MENHNPCSFWSESIVCPIDGSTGIDLSKNEKFFQIKSEINKLEDMAADKVKISCIQLLCDKSKDLRLLVYLIFACLIKEDSLDEWQGALHALMSCLIKYESKLYPRRPAAKIATLLWLNQERVKLIFIERIRNASYEKLVEYQQSACNLNRWLAGNTFFSAESVKIGFERWLRDHIEAFHVQTKKITRVNAVILPEKRHTVEPVIKKEPVTSSIKNMTEVESATMLIVKYCELHGRLIQAAAYRRALRWSALTPRVDDFGITALSNFSEENTLLLNQCQESYLSNPKECYEKCEALFLMPGGQVKLDIQYYAIKSAEVFNEALATSLKDYLYGFVKKFPGVEKWRYNNKESCTSSIVFQWIQNTILMSNSSDVKVACRKEISMPDKYKQVLEERELFLLKKICNIG